MELEARLLEATGGLRHPRSGPDPRDWHGGPTVDKPLLRANVETQTLLSALRNSSRAHSTHCCDPARHPGTQATWAGAHSGSLQLEKRWRSAESWRGALRSCRIRPDRYGSGRCGGALAASCRWRSRAGRGHRSTNVDLTQTKHRQRRGVVASPCRHSASLVTRRTPRAWRRRDATAWRGSFYVPESNAIRK